MSHSLLPLCSLPKLATRDGSVGAFARLLLPFYEGGYWFANGQIYSFPTSTIAQDTSQVSGGTHKANTFKKAAGVCN